MENREEEYNRKMAEIDRLLREPETSNEINEFLTKFQKKFGCDFRLMYEYYPEMIEYDEIVEHQRATIERDVPTMTLGEFIKFIDKEDHEIKVYIDPLYMGKGVNAIKDILTTTAGDDAMIIAPVSHNKR